MTGPRSIQVRPLTGSIGAEVEGVDLNDVGDRVWDALRSAWLEHLVLFFPDQHLDANGHIALAKHVGEIDVHPFLPKLDDEHPEIVVLDSDDDFHADAEKWHTDVTFSARPPMASILRMVVLPDAGGDTMWQNQYLAYETLSPPIRDLVDGLTAVHRSNARADHSAVHPAVCVHPETGRRALFVNRTFTSHFVELDRHASDALLGLLFSWSEQPRFQCRYRWTDGAIGIWDNRCTQHFAVNDYQSRRVIHRVTVQGDVPIGLRR